MIDFASPQWFILLLVLPFLVGLKVWSRTRSSRGVDAFVAKRLQLALVHKTPAPADWIAFSLQLLAIALFVAAIARPQWGFREIETLTKGRNVIIAIDTSNSMLAEDLQPNRLTRAKLAAQDLVRNLPTDRIGLIAFAGRAFAQAPLTVDHEAVLESIDQMDTEVISRGGTNLVEPAVLALDTMQEAEANLAALVIFSDGEDLEGQQQLQELQESASESKLLIVAVGVGTESGGIIPDPLAKKPGVFIKDEAGKIVRSRLDPVALRQLADMTDGVYLNMGSQSSVSDVVRQALRKLEAQQLEADATRIPIERYAIPLVLGMMALILSHAWPQVPIRASLTRTVTT
ncbi:MAG: VWA domain-containing protein [Verrucomicrobiota bacterium]